ncbi:MAG: RNA 2',3'-cyclic phosphodiesterase [Candidatus Diapherotrites archaeon]|nr:RNA 2',3'-cyclic phosphodiesterase [Candidatus Diapherotrites archaeon]
MPPLTQQNTLRTFLAITPPPLIQAGIEHTYGPLLDPFALKRPQKGQFHITLAFLGKIPRKKVPGIIKKLQVLRETQAFNITLQGMGAFSTRVIWMGVSQGTEELHALHENTCRALNLRVKKFHAHLTLARNRHLAQKAFKETVERLSEKEFNQAFQAKGINLMESTLTPTGSTYAECTFIPFKELPAEC